VVLKDGGASGTAKITLNTPAVAEMFNALLPGEGIKFSTDVYVDVTNVASVTVFYG
jgi:flagellar basal body P-ring protein FlgI